MLELIVLGQVPGTSLVITFNQVLVIVACLIISFEMQRIVRRRRITQQTGSSENTDATA